MKRFFMRSGDWENLVIGCCWTSYDGFGAQLYCMFNEESKLDQGLANKEANPLCCVMFIFVNKVLLVYSHPHSFVGPQLIYLPEQ